LLFVPAALTTAFMMPFIGQMLQKGVKQQYLVSLGLLTFFFFCFWGHNILTPDTPKSAFFWPLILRGVAMGMLFIPITTLSLSTLKGKQIGEGAAFTGMMRQLGGSFGVAIISTFMARQTMTHRGALVSKLDVTDPDLQNRVLGMQQSFAARGQDPHAAFKALDYSVMKQAAVLSYMDAFLYIGLLFLVCIPFVLLVRGKRNKQVKMELH